MSDEDDPVCLVTASKRTKCAKEPQAKISVTSQSKTPQVAKSQESLSSECNFQDFENLESLNRHRSSFAKRQLQDYWCDLLIKFHSSNQDISALKNIPKEHLQWVKQMAKRSSVIDGLLMYRDEFMEDPDHYRIMVPNDIQLQRHLLRVYHDSLLGMHRGRELPMDPFHMTFIGEIWLSMCGTGSGDAPPVSNLSLLIPNMGRCRFAYMTVPSAPLE